MKAITAALLILASALTIHFALGAFSPDRAPGVAERDWMAVSDKISFVVTTPHYYSGLGGGDQPLLLIRPTEGYPTCHSSRSAAGLTPAGSSWRAVRRRPK
jgi:hypothetical protein